MAARAKFAVASFVLFATAWLLLDWGTAGGEGEGPALRGVRRLSQLVTDSDSGSGSGINSIRQRNGSIFVGQAIWQCIYGAIYFFVVVRNYPELQGDPTEKAKDTQSKNELTAFCTCENSCVINLTSFFCSAGRAAHTYDKVGLMPYWLGLFLSAFCPCGALFYMNACTDLNEKLGGERRGILSAILCSWCFPCCVIAQDAQALDECTGVAVGLCGVEEPDGDQSE